MILRATVLFFMLCFFGTGYGQTPKPARIPFLDFTPIIDGKPDDQLKFLEKRKFNHFFQFDNPTANNTPITYQLAYTATHLYLFIEVKADSITHRDRGFINGDGFKLLLAKPQKDSLTDEYYDIVFSPSKNRKYWARKRIWDYNRNQDHGKRLSPETVFEEQSYNGKCGFEVLLAWKDIEPYHPWFSQQLGYNLYFAKAIANNAANGHAVVKDEGIWDEEIPKRNFAPVVFEEPKTITKEFIMVKPAKRNTTVGEPLLLDLVSMSTTVKSGIIDVIVQNDASKMVLNRKINHRFQKKLLKESAKLDLGNLPPAYYKLLVRSQKDTIARYDFIVFPKLDFNAIRSQITTNAQHLETGTANTLLFKITAIEQDLAKLKPYETGKKILDDYLQFDTEFHQFLNGNEPYEGITKPYRRAFKSGYDGTFQPYTIKLPQGYDPAKKYPLLIFLHGSGQDEQNVLDNARSGGNFIEVAPFARDMYACYASDSSQKDIVEAIEDVLLHFSADKDKIIIGGFSMGGYGALRTFYEHPGLYKGVAVFAGHPDLANEWLGAGHPDFLDDKFLTDFSKIPVFIYHGRKDGALPVSKAEELAAKLESNGIDVTLRLIDDKAHDYPDDETNKIYFEWLDKIIGE